VKITGMLTGRHRAADLPKSRAQSHSAAEQTHLHHTDQVNRNRLPEPHLFSGMTWALGIHMVSL
jgi:hypothetical protein